MGKKIELTIKAQNKINLNIPENKKLSLDISRSGGGGAYPPLTQKPSVNDVVLLGNKTFEDLGDHILTNIEIKTLFDRVFKQGGN